MSSITVTYQPQSKPVRFPWWPVVVVLILSAVVVGTQYSHALARHAQGAIDARNCFDQHGNAMRWFNPFREAYVMVCQEKPGSQVYLRILRVIKGKVEEISSYPKDHCYWLEDVAKVLEDQGAILEWTR